MRVVDLFSIVPVDAEELVRSLGECNNNVMVVEEHFENGGLGDAVRRALTGKQCQFKHKCVRELPFSGTPTDLFKAFRFDAGSIKEDILDMLN